MPTLKTRKSRLEFIYQFEVNKGTKEVFGNFFFKATKSENSSLFSAIPKEWRRLFKTKENAALLHDNFVDLDSFSLSLGGEKLDVKEIQSKLLHATFSCKTSSNPTSTK